VDRFPEEVIALLDGPALGEFKNPLISRAPDGASIFCFLESVKEIHKLNNK
jgi:hypothetical protein